MKLTKLSNEDVYRLLSQKMSNEIDAIRDGLSKQIEPNIVDQNLAKFKGEVSGLEFSLNEALDNTSGQLNDMISDVKHKLDQINLTEATSKINDDVSELQNEIINILRTLEEEEEELENEDKVTDTTLDRLKQIEEKLARMQAAPFVALGGSSGGGSVAIKYVDENGDLIEVTPAAKCIVFQGEDVLVQPSPTDPDCVDVYIPPPAFSITSFTANPNLVEVGTVIDDVALAWTYSVTDVTNQVLTGPGTYTQPSDPTRAAAVSMLGSDRINSTWTIKGEDVLTGLTDSANVTLFFGANFYFGKSNNPIDETVIESLNSELRTGRASNISIGASGSSVYMIVSYPASWGAYGDFIDVNTGFKVPFTEEPQVDVTNGNGYKTPYRVYRSFQQVGGAFDMSNSGNSGQQLPPSS